MNIARSILRILAVFLNLKGYKILADRNDKLEWPLDKTISSFCEADVTDIGPDSEIIKVSNTLRAERSAFITLSTDALTQKRFVRAIRLPERTYSQPKSQNYLRQLLTTLINRDLKNCDLIILTDETFSDMKILLTLAHHPNSKQIATIGSSLGDLTKEVFWKSNRCQGIMALISDPSQFIAFGDDGDFAWDFGARVIVVGLKEAELELFVRTKKAKKTERIIGIVQASQPDTYNVYMNQLFWEDRGLKRVTSWRADTSSLMSDLFPDKISNLQQATLTLLVFEWQPAIMYRRDSDGELLERYGRDVEVLKALKRAFNFTVTSMEPDPKELFGVPLPNGSYSGMVGLLHKGIGDIAIANHWIMMERAPFLAYSTPFSIDQGCCLARIEPPLPVWQSPGLPFRPTTWTAIFVGVICAGPVLYLVAKGSGTREPEVSSFLSRSTSILFTFGIHFSQPMATLPKGTGTQIFIAFLWIYSIILTTGYRSNLVAFLTIAKPPASIETFKELYDSGITLTGHPYFKNEFVISEIEHLRALASRYSGEQRFDHTEGDVLAGRAVTLNSRSYLEFFVGQTTTSGGKPVFRIMKECTAQHSVAVAYQRNSPLKPKFDHMITQIFESGLPRRWFFESMDTYRKLQKEKEESDPVLKGTRREGVTALALDHLQGVFFIWGFGQIISTFLFIIEIIAPA